MFKGEMYLVWLADTVDTDRVVTGEAVKVVVSPVLDVPAPAGPLVPGVVAGEGLTGRLRPDLQLVTALRTSCLGMTGSVASCHRYGVCSVVGRGH